VITNLQQVTVAQPGVHLGRRHLRVRSGQLPERHQFIGRDVGAILLREQERIHPVSATLGDDDGAMHVSFTRLLKTPPLRSSAWPAIIC
jgi:hypothetical protein